jgi:hypothetical protein
MERRISVESRYPLQRYRFLMTDIRHHGTMFSLTVEQFSHSFLFPSQASSIALKSFQLLRKKGYNLIIIFGHEVVEKNGVTGLTAQGAFDILDRKMIEAIRLVSR